MPTKTVELLLIINYQITWGPIFVDCLKLQGFLGTQFRLLSYTFKNINFITLIY